jgi:periplasmic protein TonB
VSRTLQVAALAACVACGRGGDGEARPGPEMPVVVNSESPFQYPADLFDQGVEGEVRLRLFVDAQGRVVAESTRVASSSGVPGFDSTAVRGAPGLRFAPGTRDGRPVAMAFYLPVVFRRYAAPSGNPTP